MLRRLEAPSPPRAPPVRPAGAGAARGSELAAGGLGHRRSARPGSPVVSAGHRV